MAQSKSRVPSSRVAKRVAGEDFESESQARKRSGLSRPAASVAELGENVLVEDPPVVRAGEGLQIDVDVLAE